MGLFISAFIAKSLCKEYPIQVISEINKGSIFSFAVVNRPKYETGL